MLNVVVDYLKIIDSEVMKEVFARAGGHVTKDQIRYNSSHSTVLTTLRYVITVPSVWKQETIQVMKTALFRAGIIRSVNASEDDCMFALEPEAASVFAKKDAEEQRNALGEYSNPPTGRI